MIFDININVTIKIIKDMSKKNVIIGIDLGTTNSCVAVIEGGEPIVIPNSEGKRTTPSVIGFSGEDRKIGDPAKRQAVTNPSKTIYSIKRFIGKDFDKIKDMVSNVPYKLESKNNIPVVKIDDREYTPQELSAMILSKMKKTAEDFLGCDVDRAIITVPAYFGDQERNSTIEAGKIAGLVVERIINEPTAAALAYGLDKSDEDKKIAVFDLGGGTMDFSILDLGDGVFEVLSTDGDVSLGGDNFDESIIKWLVDEFKSEHSVDLSKEPMALQRLKEAAEKAKIELSTTTTTEINLPYIIPVDNIPQHLVKTLSRSKFDQLTSDLVNRTIVPCKKALKASGLSKSDIDDIILVGGSTRILSVQKAVEDFFGKPLNKSVNADEVVAIGAAIQGGVLTGDVSDVLLLDVTPLSLGIETMGGVFTKLIESNTTIPTQRSETFSTAADNQNSVQIKIGNGERPMFKDNKSLGEFFLDNIPPAPRGIPQIEVTFDIDVNGILSVSAKDKATGKENNIRIESNGQLSEEEINKMKMEAEQNEEADKLVKEKVDKLNEADSMIFNTEKQLKEFSDKLSDENKQLVNDSLSKLKEAHLEEDIDKINNSLSELTESWNKASTEMYEKSDSNNSNADVDVDNIDDVDFEEVKED